MFDSYVAPPRPSLKRRALFIGSIAFHVVLAAGLAVWSLLHVEELAPPEVTLTFFNAAPPPPPPPPPPAAVKKVAANPKVMSQKVRYEPLPAEPQKEPEPAEAPSDEGVAGGVPGGVPGGVVGAPPTEAVAPPPPPPPPAAPKTVASFVFDRERLQAPDPHLPDEFKNRHPKETFTATYRICVGTDGRISDVTVVRGIGGVDDEIARQLRATWTYKPQPVPVCSVRNFVFKVN